MQETSYLVICDYQMNPVALEIELSFYCTGNLCNYLYTSKLILKCIKIKN